jgi:hypothetical protein
MRNPMVDLAGADWYWPLCKDLGYYWDFGIGGPIDLEVALKSELSDVFNRHS